MTIIGSIRRIVGGGGVGRNYGCVGVGLVGGSNRDPADGDLDYASVPPPPEHMPEPSPRSSHTNNVVSLDAAASHEGHRDDAPSSSRRNDDADISASSILAVARGNGRADDASPLASSSSSNGRMGDDDVPTSSSATCAASRVRSGARRGGGKKASSSSSSPMCMGAYDAMDSVLGKLADVVLDCISHGRMDDACREWTNVPQARECKFF